MSGLAIRGLTVRREGCPVVDTVDLDAAPGAVSVLIGPNGAGKSSLLKAVLGLLPSTGSISLDSADPRRLDPAARARLVAYVPQRSQLASAIPVRAAVAAARYAHAGWLGGTATADAAAVESALASADALHLAGRPFNALSAGEQQRVLVARALASGARTILMDEPTASLDVGHALALLALTRRLATEGRCIVLVLHHLDDARRVGDHLVLMHRGRVLAAGQPREVLQPGPLGIAFRVVPDPGGAMGFRPLAEAAT